MDEDSGFLALRWNNHERTFSSILDSLRTQVTTTSKWNDNVFINIKENNWLMNYINTLEFWDIAITFFIDRDVNNVLLSLTVHGTSGIVLWR